MARVCLHLRSILVILGAHLAEHGQVGPRKAKGPPECGKTQLNSSCRCPGVYPRQARVRFCVCLGTSPGGPAHKGGGQGGAHAPTILSEVEPIFSASRHTGVGTEMRRPPVLYRRSPRRGIILGPTPPLSLVELRPTQPPLGGGPPVWDHKVI